MSEKWKSMFPSMQWLEYLHHKLVEDWILSPTCRANCNNYFLRHWEFDHYKLQLMYNKDWGYWYIIGADGTKYRVIPKELGLEKYSQLALSFRSAVPELNLPAYVLVKGIENKSSGFRNSGRTTVLQICKKALETEGYTCDLKQDKDEYKEIMEVEKELKDQQ